MAIVTKGKMTAKGNEAIKKMYSEAINGTENFSWAKPASYTEEQILDLYEAKQLYRPLAVSFKLV
jgi:hypothetical protein